MGQIASLVLGFGVNTSGLSTGLKVAANDVDLFYLKTGEKIKNLASPITNTVKAAGDLGKSFGRLASSALDPLGLVSGAIGGLAPIASTAGAAVAGLALGLAGAGLAAVGVAAALTSGGLDRIDQLGDAAARLGTTTAALSELRYGANLTGSSAEDLDAALEKLNANLGDSTSKATPASAALERIGLDAKELAKLDPAVAFRRIVDGFKTVPDAATKASLAMDVFGKGGLKVLNTLSASGEDLDKLAAEARKFGVSVNAVDQAKIGAAKDALDRAGASVEGIGNKLAIKLAPFIEAAANKLADLVAGFLDGGSAIDKALDGIAQAVAFLLDGAASLASGFLSAFATIAEGAAKVADFIGVGAETTRAAAEGLRSAADFASDAKPGEALLRFYSDVKSTAQSAAEGVAKLAGENLGLGKTLETLGTSIKTVTDKLKEQVQAFGLSAEEAQLLKLKQDGATESQLAGARALTVQLKALEKAKKAKEELEGFAKGAKDAARSPLGKAAEEIRKIDEALGKGLLDKNEALALKVKAGKDAGLGGEAKFAGALQAGSSEARSAVLAATTGGAGSAVLRAAQAQLAKTEQGNGYLQKILAALSVAPTPEAVINF